MEIGEFAERLRTMSLNDEGAFAKELLHHFSENHWTVGEVERAIDKIQLIGEKLQREIKRNSKRVEESKRFEFVDAKTFQ